MVLFPQSHDENYFTTYICVTVCNFQHVFYAYYLTRFHNNPALKTSLSIFGKIGGSFILNDPGATAVEL